MNSEIKEHYKKLFLQHGMDPKSVQWSDSITQTNRFKILSEIDANLKSVIDVGCGLGDFFTYLKKDKEFSGKYLGLDYLQEFVDACNEQFRSEGNTAFQLFDLTTDEFPPAYDYIFLSGVFNNKIEQDEQFMYQSIEKMFKAALKGVSFNALSTYVDYQDDGLFYSNPLAVFDFCKKNITRKITLRHDYLVKEGSIPFEYTIYLYK
jgi:SAM-dependent methyltransferase